MYNVLYDTSPNYILMVLQIYKNDVIPYFFFSYWSSSLIMLKINVNLIEFL